MTAPFLTRLRLDPDRCSSCGWHPATQGHCDTCTESNEWDVFMGALKRAADSEGRISQTNMRPLIASIPAKRRGLLYRSARNANVIVEAGKEPSTDIAGRNGDKDQRVYRLVAA